MPPKGKSRSKSPARRRSKSRSKSPARKLKNKLRSKSPVRRNAKLDVLTKPKDAPSFLYKTMLASDWEECKKSNDAPHVVSLNPIDIDSGFIHFATKEQLKKVMEKFWPGKRIAIVEIDVSKLEGDLIHEVNPGGSNLYYHLYNGYIPFGAVVGEPKIVNVPN